MKLEELKKENKNLKKENIELKSKLSLARLWMEKEIRSEVVKISKRKVSKMTKETKNTFVNENIDEIITKKVSDFFGELMLLNTPAAVVENIISAEISYFSLKENPKADGLGVITSFHKALDALIEPFIIKGFRKFAHKKGQTQLRKNDPLEKALNSVVLKGYLLSVGRLFHIVKLIKHDEELFDYGRCFKEYLKKYSTISDILFDDDLYEVFEELVSSEILGKKRHIGKISLAETKRARTLLIGDFKNENSLIFKFTEIGKVDC